MKIYRFNTNITNTDIENTESMQQISKTLNQDRRIISFKVDVKGPNHEMEVSCNENITENEVRQLVSMAGFETFNSNENPGNATR
jgi:hypothetical protein